MKKFLLIIIALSAYIFSYAQCTDLFFSEYVEGSANNKALEIYNPTNHTIDLTGYVVKKYGNGSTSSTSGGETNLVGTIQPYGTFVLVNGQTTSTETSPRCDSVLQAMADQLDHDYPSPTYMNGNDAITLEKVDGTIVDIFGKVGEDPVEGWYDQDSTNYITNLFWLSWTSNHTLVRKPSVRQGVTQNPGSVGAPEFFMVNVEWDTLPVDTWDSLGSHTCDCLNQMILDYTSVNPICYGDANGSIDLSVSGGTEPYSYNWSNGATSQDINNLAAGTYTVTVTDSNTDYNSMSIDIIAPDSISVNYNYGVNQICYGDSTGSIDVNVSGGIAPYSYIWSNGATTEDLNNLKAGTYTVTVTDFNGCNNSKKFEIEEHAKITTDSIEGSQQVVQGELNIYFVTENLNSTYNWMISSNGSIISGQTTNLVYARWNSSGIGFVSVLETNQYGCSGDPVNLKTNIGTTGVNNIDKQNFVIISPNPSKGIFNIKIGNNCNDNIKFEIVNIKGQCVFNEQFKNINSDIVKQINLTDYPKGMYYVKIESDNFIEYKKIIIL